jgi:1,4-dihydroxy-6-naphthoate synthase
MNYNQTLTLAFSPCPNDTFIFDALAHQKIDTEGLDFKVELMDVESLNEHAVKGSFDITKLSYHAFAYVAKSYILLNSGSALGKGCGPLLIAKNPMSVLEINNGKIAIPGKLTTANFLFCLTYPDAKNKTTVVFSDIEEGVLNGTFDAGVIIHENRFTYAQKNLVKICDLGVEWENNTGFPIPLGGIAMKRNLPLELQKTVDRLIQKSIEFAFANPTESLSFVREHAQEMDANVRMQHIQLYVNQYSLNLGETGIKAVHHLLQKGAAVGLYPPIQQAVIL